MVQPRIKSHSAKIGHHSVTTNAAVALCSEAFEFCDAHQSAADGVVRVLIMYATEYGFAREVARKTAAYLSRTHIDVGPTVQYDDDDSTGTARKIHARVVNTLNYSAIDFSRETLLLFVCSTTGDGVPPNESEALRDALRDGALTLPNTLKYGVLALGDSGYPHFCRGGLIFDELFSKTEATCSIPCVTVDQENWQVVLKWAKSIVPLVNSFQPTTQPEYLRESLERVAHDLSASTTRYTRANAYSATLVSRIALCYNPPRKVKDPKNVIRVEFEIDPAKLTYTPGDAVGVLPVNNPEAVNGILKLIAANGDELVTLDGPDAKQMSIEVALMEKLDLRVIRPELIQVLGTTCTAKSERALYETLIDTSETTTVKFTESGKEYTNIRHVVDVLSDFGSAQLSVKEFARLLRPLQTRYYSISSHQPNRIAATLDVVRYTNRGVGREGVASTYLNDRVRLNDEVRIFVSRNSDFRLPTNGDLPILMICAGTGIAPYIAFLNERFENRDSGKNVLYFGCRHEDHDFLYRDLLTSWEKSNVLHLFTAFSRDQAQKVYVQSLLRNNAKDVWNLLTQGAHVYVCGDGNQMARDVDDALRDVVLQHGDVDGDVELARNYLLDLQKARRYQRDVWVS